MSNSHVPTALKTAVVVPILKKVSLDPDILKNYRPVSNLPYLAKLLEKVVCKRLQDHKMINSLYEPAQSAYRAGHSTETAVLKVHNDILRSIDDGHCVFLVLLDLSAAFDTVHHETLLRRMEAEFGVVGAAHEWLASYLADRTQAVTISGSKSALIPLTCGVPQGSVLGPDLFSDYSSPVASLIREFNISVHCYADDTQLYCSFKPGITECDVLETLVRCIDKLRVWMNSNKLKLNDDKTEFMILGSPNSLKQVKTESIRIGDFNIKAVASVRNIGAMFDSQMKMEVQVRSMCKSAWYHLYNISKVRRLLTLDQTKTVIHAYVTSKIDSNNALLSGLPTCLLHKLQLVQNAAARVVTRNKKGDHVTPLLIELHWLPVDKRILYKIMLTCFKALNDIGPIYISDLLTVSTPNRPGLRSDDDILHLVLPKTRLKTYGDRAFSYYAVYHWNRLPFSIRASPTITTFKSRLKTHFFKDSFGAT